MGWPPQRGRKPPRSDSQHFTPVKTRTRIEEEEEEKKKNSNLGTFVFLERTLHSRRRWEAGAHVA